MGRAKVTDKTLWRSGDWALTRTQGEAVRILEVLDLWGKSACLVWQPAAGTVATAPAAELIPVSAAKVPSQPAIVYAVAAAKIMDSLAQSDLFLAPLEGTVVPLPHQLYALARALAGQRVRYLLADEVGLGKTIEAGLIMRELKLRGLVHRTLVVAPKGLVLQWVQEMQNHFNESFQLVIPAEMGALSYLAEDGNFWRRIPQAVVPLDSVKPIQGRRGWTHDEVQRYNRERFEKLVTGGWDLVIVDEAHRLAGSSDTVARYRLGRALAEAAPYVLFLSATPHQGKSDAFHRLVNLLDDEAFPTVDAVERERVAPYVIRTEKRQAVNLDGQPLFKPRQTQLIPIVWQEQHRLQCELYERVTAYVREGYNQALKEKRYYIGFLMVMMQRLVASSTQAIRLALERRLEVIEGATPYVLNEDLLPDEDWWELDGQEQLEHILKQRLLAFATEREEVQALLSLARRASQQPDARAAELLQWLYRLQAEERNPELKFLVFTEFLATQEMLANFLTGNGFEVTYLNGSMDLQQRQQVQAEFAGEKQVLISTDAGGEGLNLQFCHVVINYDLPWNPMRLEQRIGRVDRIGQKHPVRALNFILEDTVEYRVQEVLEEKLATILTDLGVDKISDVLDSSEVAADWENLYKEAVLKPEEAASRTEAFAAALRRRLEEAQLASNVLSTASQLDVNWAQRLANHPLPYWVELMTTGFLYASGGTVQRRLRGYDLVWPDGYRQEGVTFWRQDEVKHDLTYLSLADPRVRSLVHRLPRHLPGQPLVGLQLSGLKSEIAGWWGLWRVSLGSTSAGSSRVFPLFIHENRRLLLPTARRIWDLLLQENTAMQITGAIKGEQAETGFYILAEQAEIYGQGVFQDLEARHREYLAQERDKAEFAIAARRQAISRLGLPAVRRKRLNQLESDYQKRILELEEMAQVFPELTCVIMIYIEGAEP